MPEKIGTFAVLSDLHLGSGIEKDKREKDFIKFINNLNKRDLILLGDIFDFWFEYESVVYKRYLNVLCALKNFMQRGNRIFFVPGNHDFYRTNFLNDFGFIVKERGITLKLGTVKVFLHHGDTFSLSGRFTRFIYGNPMTKFVFGLLHPDIGLKIANIVSKTSRKVEQASQGVMPKGSEIYLNKYDIVISGHTHTPTIKKVMPGKYYINTGDWLFKRTYLLIESGKFVLYDKNRVIEKMEIKVTL